MHLLYLNGEKLYDCADMDDKNIHFSDIIKVNLFSFVDCEILLVL
jgi:hypothetical protein